jgi:hypothetical protein
MVWARPSVTVQGRGLFLFFGDVLPFLGSVGNGIFCFVGFAVMGGGFICSWPVERMFGTMCYTAGNVRFVFGSCHYIRKDGVNFITIRKNTVSSRYFSTVFIC